MPCRRFSATVAGVCAILSWNAVQARSDTTSWPVRSVEWSVDQSDAIALARLLPAEEGSASKREVVEIVEVIKDHPGLPDRRAELRKTTHGLPDDLLVVFFRLGREGLVEEEIINTSRPVELIHYENGLRSPEFHEHSFIAMDALGRVIESREDLLACIRRRMKMDVPPLTSEQVRPHEWTYLGLTPYGYKRPIPEDYESGGYDVALTLLIPLDPYVVGELEKQGLNHALDPSIYLGAQALVRNRHIEDIPPAQAASAADSAAKVTAWASSSPAAPGRTVSLEKPGVGYGGAETHSFLISPDGKRLIDCGQPNGCRAYDMASGEQLYRLNVFIDPATATFSTDGRFVAWAGHYNGPVSLLDAEAGKLLFQSQGQFATFRFSRDGRRFAYVQRAEGGESFFSLWDLDEVRLAGRVKLVGAEPFARLLDSGTTGRFALVQHSEESVLRLTVFDAETGEAVLRLPPGARHGAIGPEDRTAAMLSDAAEEPVGPEGRVVAVRNLAVLSVDGGKELLRTKVPAQYERLEYLGEDLLCVAAPHGPDGGRALVFSIHTDRCRGQVLRWR